MAIDENEVRQALGIDEKADIGGAIRTIKARVSELEATLKADAGGAEKAEFAKLQGDLAEAQRRLVTLETETSMKIVKLEQERNEEHAIAFIEGAIAKGRAFPVQREMLISMYVRDPKGTEDFMATLPSIDMRERGVASGSELAALEPTPMEIGIAKQMGTWDESKPVESRIALMRVKAQEKGLTLPAEAK